MSDSNISKLKDLSECPICFELLIPPVYQCYEGHIICSICIEKISDCPSCRETLPTKKIRNRAVEDLLSDEQMDCRNASLGCKGRISRASMSDHLQNICVYRAFPYCKFLFPDRICKKDIGKTELKKHIATAHPDIEILEASRVNIVKYAPNEDNSFHFIPFCLSFQSEIFVIVACYHSENKVFKTSISLASPPSKYDDAGKYFGEIRSESTNSGGNVVVSTGRILASSLLPARHGGIDLTLSNVDLNEFKISMRISKSRKRVIDDGVEASVECLPLKFTDHHHYSSEFYNGLNPHPRVTCDNCESNINGIRYKCLECPNYDLCQQCERCYDGHNHHLFLRSSCPTQENWVNSVFDYFREFSVNKTRKFVCFSPPARPARKHFRFRPANQTE